MASLGQFGTPRDEAEQDTFGWFGVEVRTNPNFSDLDLADFMEVAGALDFTDVKQAVAAMGAIKAFLRTSIHPDDFEEFWQIGRENRQGLTDLLQVAWRVVEAATGRPTVRPSVSTDGPSGTRESSSLDAASVASRAYPGRPDLQVATLRAVS